jgi:xanthine dehydrogenase accessory factor
MQETKAIVEAYDASIRQGIKSALATVVHVTGSSYRRPGARMLVTEYGQLTGAISGGCLEGDALRKAVLAISQGKNKLVIYDTTDEDDAKLGIQLGCNGMVSILFEPIDQENPVPINCLRQSINTRTASIIITGYSLNQETHIGTVDPIAYNGLYNAQIQTITKQVMQSKSSIHELLTIDGNEQQFFFEYSLPAIALLIVGAGNDSIPLMKLAALVGWFQQTEKIIVGKPQAIIHQLHFDERTAVVLMTHNYQYDLEMLSLLLDQPIAYIGLLGPAAKRDRMLNDLSLSGMMVTEEQMEKIYGPTGLNLGAETAEEIALSIGSEIMSVLHGKEPIHLNQKIKSIHEHL